MFIALLQPLQVPDFSLFHIPKLLKLDFKIWMTFSSLLVPHS